MTLQGVVIDAAAFTGVVAEVGKDASNTFRNMTEGIRDHHARSEYLPGRVTT